MTSVVTLGARSLQFGRGGHHWWPPLSHWGPLGAGPADAESLGPGIRPRSESSGAVSDRCLACEKKRESLKSCRPAGLYKDNWGPPGLAPELGISNNHSRGPPKPSSRIGRPGPSSLVRTMTASLFPGAFPPPGRNLCPIRRGNAVVFVFEML